MMSFDTSDASGCSRHPRSSTRCAAIEFFGAEQEAVHDVSQHLKSSNCIYKVSCAFAGSFCNM